MHNEVAPGQDEISRIFALSNVSVDQNALCQDVFSQCTSEHGLTLLLHKNLSVGRILKILQLEFQHEHWTKSLRAWEDERSVSLLALQAPTALLVEEEDGVLVEPRLMRTCSWSASHPIWC